MTTAKRRIKYPAPIIDFADYKLKTEKRSPLTVDEYLIDLRTFSRYIIAIKNSVSTNPASLEKIDISSLDTNFYSDISAEEINQFISYMLHERKNKSSSVSRKISSIKSFYNFLYEKQCSIDVNPASYTEHISKCENVHAFFSVEEARMLLDAAKNAPESSIKERDIAIITLFLNCGLKLSELAGIKLTDIDPKLKILTINGKHKKTIYLNKQSRDALDSYLKSRVRIRIPGDDENILFLSRIGKKISAKTIQRAVQKHLRSAGLGYNNYSIEDIRQIYSYINNTGETL